MKNLFSVKFIAAAVIAGGMMFTFASCEDDPCKDVTCVNGEAVASGDDCACDCDAGYEGDDCTTLTRSKFVGTWGVSEDCSLSNPAAYTVTITADASNNDKILIDGLWQLFNNPVVATVDGNELTIASQEPDGDDFFINGSGTIVVNGAVSTITATYNVEDRTGTTTTTDVCTGSTWVK